MNLHQIRYFLAITETGSFTKGAERSNVSQPTLSAAIKKLEEELGAALFDRGRRRAELTPAGIRFHDRARTIVHEYNAAKADFREADPGHHVRLGALRGLGGVGLARLLADFAKAHGEVSLELLDGTRDELSAWLRRDRIDVAITELPDNAAAEDADAGRRSVPLFRERLHLAVAERHRLASRASVRLADLSGEPFILRRHCEIHNAARRQFSDRRIRPNIIYRTDQDAWTLALVAAGVGHAMMSPSHRTPGVSFIAIADLDVGRTVGLVWRAAEANPAIEALRAFAASHDWHTISAESDGLQSWAH